MGLVYAKYPYFWAKRFFFRIFIIHLSKILDIFRGNRAYFASRQTNRASFFSIYWCLFFYVTFWLNFVARVTFNRLYYLLIFIFFNNGWRINMLSRPYVPIASANFLTFRRQRSCRLVLSSYSFIETKLYSLNL